MSGKKYPLDIYELRGLIQGYVNEGLQIEDYLKSKKPVEEVASGWDIVSSGEVCLTTEGYEGSCTGVYLDTGKSKIGLIELLTEEQAIKLEGSHITISIRKDI